MNLNRFLVAFIAIAAIGLSVMAAIATNALGWLILGVLILSGLAVLLANISVGLFTKAAPVVLKMRMLQYDQDLKMIELGFLPMDRRYKFTPQLAEPDQFDIPVSVDGVTAKFVLDHQQDAVELLALSKQIMGELSTQIVPFHKARKNPYFASVSIWMDAVKVLLVNRLAEERYKDGPNGRKKLGTFLMSGTVEQAYVLLKQRTPTPLPDTQRS